MHRVVLVAMLAAALLVPSAWSQRGGGARAMDGHVGFSHAPAFAGHSGFSGHQAGFASHNSVFVGHGFGHFGGPFPHRFVHGGFGNRFFFSAGFGFPLAYPYYYGGYYPSYYSYPYSYAPAYAYPPAYYDDSDSEERRRLEYEIERLNQRIDRLNAGRGGGDAESTDNKHLSNKDAGIKSKSVMLVFRNKHVQEVENYAVVGSTLWWFSEQRAKKIPLSDLDLVATAKLNDERGIDFALPPPPKKK